MSGEPSEPLSRAEAAAIAIALRERVAEARGVLLWGEQALRVAATLDAARSASDTPRDLREGPCRFCGQPNASDEHYGPASTHSYVATAVVFETALATLDAALGGFGTMSAAGIGQGANDARVPRSRPSVTSPLNPLHDAAVNEPLLSAAWAAVDWLEGWHTDQAEGDAATATRLRAALTRSSEARTEPEAEGE